MSRNNDTFSVLVTKGNLPVLPKDSKITALAPGQIGVFDAGTNLSIDDTTAIVDFYLAVGIDTDGDGVTDDIAKSTGRAIQVDNIKNTSLKKYEEGSPMVFTLKNYTAECETEYGIKLEFRNQEIYRTQGYNQFTKLYTMVTSCCKGCTPTCPSGDANEITKQLVIQITNDPNGLISAIATARQALTIIAHGVSVDIALGGDVSAEDLEAIMVFNAAQTDVANFVYTDLKVTTVTQKVKNFAAINMKYFYPRETIVIPTKVEGFKCNGTLEVLTQAVFEQGAGYDIKQREYMAKGWTESPYRVSTLNGVADDKEYNAIYNEKYNQITLGYDEKSLGGWQYYDAFEASIIAIPTVDLVTFNGVSSILNALLSYNLNF